MAQSFAAHRSAPPTIDRGALERVVAVINGKGGVGKSTLTANIAGLLALSGWRVLAVDMDVQGDLGLDLGYRNTDRDDNGLALAKGLQFPDDEPRLIKDVRPNLDVLAGGGGLQAAEGALNSKTTQAGRQEAQLSLANLLIPIADNYDLILVDCPPASDALQTAAVAAARWVLIPTRLDAAGVAGLNITAQRFSTVHYLNPTLDLLGVILFDSSKSSKSVRAKLAKDVQEALGVDDATPLIFDGYVRHSERVPYELRQRGLLAHELNDKVKAEPKWYERLRAGKAAQAEQNGPASAESVATSLQEIAAEFRERLAAKEEGVEHA
jgi:chromosome partitioning protein